MAQARAFSHVGITVPDLDKAVDFYTKCFGWYVIMKPTPVASTSMEKSLTGLSPKARSGGDGSHWRATAPLMA